MGREKAWVGKWTGAALLFAGGILLVASQLRGGQDTAPATVLQIQNAHVETRALQGSLSEEIQRWAAASGKARWLGYAVETVNGQRTMCCTNDYGNSDHYCGVCSLEGGGRHVSVKRPEQAPTKVHLETEGMAVLFRAENGKVGKIRILSMDCVADADGLAVEWLENVKAADSVALLEQFVTAGAASDDREESVSKGALMAIAQHGDPSADRALDSFVSADRPEWLRKEAAFWLGAARGAQGFQMLQKMARSDPSKHVREQVTFALSVSDQPGAVEEMIRMAHEDESPQVRGQALFWLAQKAGKKAETAITGAIENDPDTDVKKKAVFALSQMPKDEGVPKLIEVAQTNKNPEVRKQAMFWLGQSQDPRALAFFEKILAQ
jgi:HEAT repeat protein